jgi:hypothetical protein
MKAPSRRRAVQIDGHHTGTYVTARLAGFDHSEAIIISYAAQYVDDATNEGVIQFSDKPYLYARSASAHSMIDYNNLIDVKNHLAWLPFHFLPGNGLLPAGQFPAGDAIGQLTCLADSSVAREMLRMAFHDRDKSRGLHRLGIAMHVYADTFAHQGFIGAISIGNRAKNVTSGDPKIDKKIRKTSKKELLTKWWRKAKAISQLLATSLTLAFREHKSPIQFWVDFFNADPLGHASADTFPDQPYLTWQYLDWAGKTVNRNNPAIFLQAFNMMLKAMQAWRAGDASMDLAKYPGLTSADAAAIEKLLLTVSDPDGEVRHKQWCRALEQGIFSFGPVTPNSLDYKPKGHGSWKEAALGTNKKEDTGLETYHYSPMFLDSHWKLFHDALQIHRIDVVHEILPRYGICAA